MKSLGSLSLQICCLGKMNIPDQTVTLYMVTDVNFSRCTNLPEFVLGKRRNPEVVYEKNDPV